jgi:hypothetical protein
MRLSAPLLELKITTPFRPSYVRNNKRNTQKNLRCFPQCCSSGHQGYQYCGGPILAELHHAGEGAAAAAAEYAAAASASGAANTRQYQVACQILPECGSPAPSLQAGQVITASQLGKLYVETEPNFDPDYSRVYAGLVLAEPRGGDDGGAAGTTASATATASTKIARFEWDPRCWQYQWKSNRNVRHHPFLAQPKLRRRRWPTPPLPSPPRASPSFCCRKVLRGTTSGRGPRGAFPTPLSFSSVVSQASFPFPCPFSLAFASLPPCPSVCTSINRGVLTHHRASTLCRHTTRQ